MSSPTHNIDEDLYLQEEQKIRYQEECIQNLKSK
jgi:hypothetical protein